MRKLEKEKLRKAIEHLERNPCEWEDAMALLHDLAGLVYVDFRKQTGKTLMLADLMAAKPSNAKVSGGGTFPPSA